MAHQKNDSKVSGFKLVKSGQPSDFENNVRQAFEKIEAGGCNIVTAVYSVAGRGLHCMAVHFEGSARAVAKVLPEIENVQQRAVPVGKRTPEDPDLRKAVEQQQAPPRVVNETPPARTGTGAGGVEPEASEDGDSAGPLMPEQIAREQGASA